MRCLEAHLLKPFIMMLAQLQNNINFAKAFREIRSVIGALKSTKGPERPLLFMQNLPKKMPKRIVIYARMWKILQAERPAQQGNCCTGSVNKTISKRMLLLP